MRYANKFVSITFHMEGTDDLILIGLQMLWKLGLVTLNLAVQANDTVGEHVRKCQIKASCRPKMTPPLLVPLSIPEGNLSTSKKSLKEFPDIFDWIGCLLGEYTINTDPDV